MKPQLQVRDKPIYLDEMEIQKDDPDFALTISNELIKINVQTLTVGAIKSSIHKLTDILNIFQDGEGKFNILSSTPLWTYKCLQPL